MVAQVIGTAAVGTSRIPVAPGESPQADSVRKATDITGRAGPSALALSPALRQELSVEVLAKTEPLTRLAARHGVILQQHGNHQSAEALARAVLRPYIRQGVKV